MMMSICEILPRSLFLGGISDAICKETLEAQKITHILSLTMKADQIIQQDVTHKHVPMEDSADEDIASHFDECFSFMTATQEAGGRLLIHCQMGISRAPTIVIAFLMKHHHYSLANALTHVKAKRPIVSPRLSFLFVLESYEHTLEVERDNEGASAFAMAMSELSLSLLDNHVEAQNTQWAITTGPAWC
eukprot:GGOE01055367.1.p1 GENE.GGOE01055367.1~~GGOE01055367.1.p1  ORF type:complete len:189 (-),score=27.99 GGOE01055367.1:450-1016(-)